MSTVPNVVAYFCGTRMSDTQPSRPQAGGAAGGHSDYVVSSDAKVAELADAPDLGSGDRKVMGVRVPPFALRQACGGVGSDQAKSDRPRKHGQDRAETDMDPSANRMFRGSPTDTTR